MSISKVKDINKVVMLEIAYDIRVARLSQAVKDAEFIYHEKYGEMIEARKHLLELREEVRLLLNWRVTK